MILNKMTSSKFFVIKLAITLAFLDCGKAITSRFAKSSDDIVVAKVLRTGILESTNDYNNHLKTKQRNMSSGIHFPIYKSIPKTNFTCRGIENGYFADISTNCQIFHICENGHKISFLCPNGTIFSQTENICEWWFNVECGSAQKPNYKKHANHNNNYLKSNPLKLHNRRMDLISNDTNFSEVGVKRSKYQKHDFFTMKNYFQRNILKSYPIEPSEIQETAESASFVKFGNLSNSFYIPIVKLKKPDRLVDIPDLLIMPATVQKTFDEKLSRHHHNFEKSNSKITKEINYKILSPTNDSRTFSNRDSEKEVIYYTPTIPTANVRNPTEYHAMFPDSVSASKMNISNHALEMIKSLENLSADTAQTIKKIRTKTGLEVPASSGPITLHTLALYFATMDPMTKQTIIAERQSNKHPEAITPVQDGDDTEDFKISLIHLSNDTKQRYEDIFNTKKKHYKSSNIKNENSSFEYVNHDLDRTFLRHSTFETLGSSQIRALAQVFTHALSAYLQDPITFRKILSAIRPTQPPERLNYTNEIDHRFVGTRSLFDEVSSLRNNQLTKNSLSATDSLEVLDFSDDKSIPNMSSILEIHETTTPVYISRRKTIKTNKRIDQKYITTQKVDKTPGSRIISETLEKNANGFFHSRRGKQIDSTKYPPTLATNKLFYTTVYPETGTIQNRKTESLFTNSEYPIRKENIELSSIFSDHVTISPELQPPSESQHIFFEIPSKFFKPPTPAGQIDVEKKKKVLLAQSQSFMPRDMKKYFGYKTYATEILTDLQTITPNKVLVNNISDIPKKYHTISESLTSTIAPELSHTTLAYIFLDPLTINDGLMDSYEGITVTPGQLSYLMNTNITDNQFFQNSMTEKGTVLDPFGPIQNKANKMFGNLNEVQYSHLMNVLKNADKNYIIRRLIQLLIKVCEGDLNNTFEKSRKALLDALLSININDIETKNSYQDVTTIPSTLKSNTKLNNLEEMEDSSGIPTVLLDLESFKITTENSISDSTTEYIEETTQAMGDTNQNTENHVLKNINFETTTEYMFNDGSHITDETSTIPTESKFVSLLATKSAEARVQKKLNNDDSIENNNNNFGDLMSPDARALELLRSLYEIATHWNR